MPNNFTKGMNQDVHPKYQPEGTYRFALNAVLETSLGEFPGISNELGNVECATDYPTSKKVIGHVQAVDDEVVLFLYDSAVSNPKHEIGIFNSTKCTYTTVAKGNCLNFSDKHPINALFRVRNGCEWVVYFTDAQNEYRIFNLTDTTYTVNPSTKEIISCERLKYSRDFRIPCITTRLQTNNSGVLDSNGALMVGTYAFAVRYLDKELNPTDWIWITRSVAIGDEHYKLTSAQQSVSYYDGASNNTTSPFYAPPTNKSISLSITNLDLDFRYYQIAVIKRTGDDGGVSGVDVLTPVPITSSTDNNFVYTGLDSQIYTTTTIEEIFAERQRLEKVVAHAQNNQKLFVANVENTSRDYSAFQRAASATKVEWVKSPFNLFHENGVKKGEYYLNNATFMDGETYPLGVFFIFSNGQKSPVFHIPGRAPDTVTGYNDYLSASLDFTGTATDGLAWDTADLTTPGAISMGSFFNIGKKARWQNMSTATAYGVSSTDGLMGYHETTTKYPVISTCDSHPDGYWGRDWQGNLIEGGVTKIRHHKMPGPELSPSSFAARTGLRFSNLVYPSSDVIGHVYVYGSRERERTVLYRGALTPLYNGVDDTMEYDVSRTFKFTEGWPAVTSPLYQKTYAFITPQHQIDATYRDGVYFKLDYMNISTIGSTSRDNASTAGGDAYHVDAYDTDIDNFDTSIFIPVIVRPTTKKLNYKVDFSAFLPKAYPGQQKGNSVRNSAISKTIFNNSINTNIQVLTLDTELKELQDGDFHTVGRCVPGGALMADVDVFNNLFNIDYVPAFNCILTQGEIPAVFTTYAGDTFLSFFNFTEFEYSQTAGGHKDIAASFTTTLFPDSDYNVEFRHGSKKEKKYSYWQPSYTLDHKDVRNYIGSKYYEESDDVMSIYAESYDYNKSFSHINSINIFRPLAFNHEMCNACTEKFPFRIYYSQTDAQETSEDKYRTIYVNNYRDLEGSKGEITDLFLNFEQLYATTPSTIYHIPTRPQVIQIEGINTYLGTGEALSIPPVQLKSTDYSFGGNQHFKSRVGTEYGTFYVDSSSKRPILLTNQIEDISLDGMRNFWQNNGGIELHKQFELLSANKYPFKGTTSKVGAGFISTYDPRYKRVIVHKRDFKILPEWENVFQYFPTTTDVTSGGPTSDGVLWFNGFSYYFNKAGTPRKVFLEDVAYFENKSFTLSYSFVTKSWVSFHSYLPYYLFNSTNSYFSVNHYDTYYSNIYVHNVEPFQTYYNTKYPHVIDFIVSNNPLNVQTNQSIVYTSRATTFDHSTQEHTEQPITYTGATIYNSKQTNGFNRLIIKDDNFQNELSNDSMLITKVENQWRFNDMWDLTIDPYQPIWDSSWAGIQSSPYSYIDKVPNQSNIDYDKSIFDQARFRDHYLGVRLEYFAPENVKLTTDLVTTMVSNKNR